MSGLRLNAYQQRLAAEATRARSIRESKNYNKVLEVNWLLRRHEEITTQLNGSPQMVTFNNGWFCVGSIHMHKAGFAKRIDVLNAQLHERELNAPED